MKKIIRWLSDISGVSDQIKFEQTKMIGAVMFQNSYWWNGGITHGKPKWDVWNAFFKYASELSRGVFCPDMMRLRGETYKLDGKPIKPGTNEIIEEFVQEN
jgi:hypothetical protein